MRFFSDDIENEVQARLNYKRLAVLYHPDRGGDEKVMREINQEYEIVKKKLRKIKRGLREIEVGDTVLVNGTECEVKAVFEETFIARAKGRFRLAVFDKKTGWDIHSRKFKAKPLL